LTLTTSDFGDYVNFRVFRALIRIMPRAADPSLHGEVNRLLDLAPLRRVLAQVDIIYSNSLIEAWWRSLRHQQPCDEWESSTAGVRLPPQPGERL